MNIDKDKRDIWIYSGLMLLLALIITFVNASGLLIMGIPVFIALFTYKNGILKGSLYVFFSAFLFLIFQSGLWLIVLMLFGVMGIVIGEGLKRKRRHDIIVFTVVIASLLGLYFLFITLEGLFDMPDISQQIETSIKAVSFPPEVLKSFSVSPVTGNKTTDIIQLEKDIKQIVLMTMPSLIFILTFLYGLVVHIIVFFILKYRKYSIRPLEKLSKIQLPGNAIVGTTLIIIMALVGSGLQPSIGSQLILNTVYIITFLFTIQGVAVVAHIVQRLNVHVFFQYLIIVVLFIFLQFIGFGIAGWLDASFGIRNRIGRGTKNEQK